MTTSNLTIDRLYQVTFKGDEDEMAGRFFVVGRNLAEAEKKSEQWAKVYYEKTPIRISSIVEQDEEIIQ